jgi:hypothetical protein
MGAKMVLRTDWAESGVVKERKCQRLLQPPMSKRHRYGTIDSVAWTIGAGLKLWKRQFGKIVAFRQFLNVTGLSMCKRARWESLAGGCDLLVIAPAPELISSTEPARYGARRIENSRTSQDRRRKSRRALKESRKKCIQDSDSLPLELIRGA